MLKLYSPETYDFSISACGKGNQKEAVMMPESEVYL